MQQKEYITQTDRRRCTSVPLHLATISDSSFKDPKMQFLFSMNAFVLVASMSQVSLSSAAAVTSSLCRYLAGDAGWPSTRSWKSLNATVGGRLVASFPLGAPCHDPMYNATECAILQSEWLTPTLQ